jgi:hypothetical protein
MPQHLQPPFARSGAFCFMGLGSADHLTQLPLSPAADARPALPRGRPSRKAVADAVTEKQSKKSIGRGGFRPGSGRPKGSVDKGNAMIREMIVQALDEAGGVDYLAQTARSHPAAFLGLVGKVMPVQLSGDGGGSIGVTLEVVGVIAPQG